MKTAVEPAPGQTHSVHRDELILTKLWLEDLRSELGSRIAAERALRVIVRLELQSFAETGVANGKA
jgi:hypothetical protein